jgi:hypothetical protein
MTNSVSAMPLAICLTSWDIGPAKDQWLVLGAPRTDQLLVVAEAIRLDHCNVQRLTLHKFGGIPQDERMLINHNNNRSLF